MVNRSVFLILLLIVGSAASLVFLKSNRINDFEIGQGFSGGDRTYAPTLPSDKLPGAASGIEITTVSKLKPGDIDDVSTESETPPATFKQSQPVGFHEVALSEVEKANLLQAPNVFLRDKPSKVLAEAMGLGRVVLVRADRYPEWNEFVTQGWIYYEPIDGLVPIILCLSQTKSVIDWMHCQKETEALSP